MRYLIVSLLILFISCDKTMELNKQEIPKEIEVSHESGVYKGGFNLELIFDSTKYEVYYTTNGSSVDTNSKKYGNEIKIDQSTLSNNNLYTQQLSNDTIKPLKKDEILKLHNLNFRVLDKTTGTWLTPTFQRTFLISSLNKSSQQIPFINITIDNRALVDHSKGIFVPGENWDSLQPDWSGNYHERGKKWERKANIFFYDAQQNIMNTQKVGLRAHGGKTRKYQQKGMRLYAKEKYGSPFFNKKILGTKKTAFKRMVLKPFKSSWSSAGIEDLLAHKMVALLNIEHSKMRPVNLYLNGLYWGIYNMSEKIDKKFFSNKYDVSENKIEIIENWAGHPQHGDASAFLALYDFVKNNDLSIKSNYEALCKQIDIQNFIDYQLFEIFIGNYDWPANNMKCWRNLSGDKKWRWIFFDGDAAFQNESSNSFEHALNTKKQEWPTSPGSTLFLRKLLENDDFYMAFEKKLFQFVNKTFNESKTNEMLNEIKADYNESIEFQINRFGYPTNILEWEERLVEIEEFLKNRKGYLLYFWDEYRKEREVN